MPPEKHALLSASSASRWLKCTAAPRFEEGLPERTSEYAEEGRLAHAICELKVLKKCTPMSTRTYPTRLNKLKKNPLYDPEMDKTTDLYGAPAPNYGAAPMPANTPPWNGGNGINPITGQPM